MQKIVEIDGIGEIVLRKNKRSRRISMRLKPMAGIVVTLPYHISYEQAIEFVLSKKDWIESNKPKIEKIENQRTIFDIKSSFPGKFHQFVFTRSRSRTTDCAIQNHKIYLRISPYADLYSKEMQDFIRSCIENALIIEAREYLVSRTVELSAKHKIVVNDIKFSKAKTRWGSCSSDNRINLNVHLMRLPDKYIDYVILHELAHITQKNHSSDFWTLLESYLPNARELDKELGSFKIQIY